MTALVFTGDVEDKLQRLQWIPRLSLWRPFRFCVWVGEIPLNTWRNNDVVITSKQRHFDVITSKWRRFDVITTSLLRNVFAGIFHVPVRYYFQMCSRGFVFTLYKAFPYFASQDEYVYLHQLALVYIQKYEDYVNVNVNESTEEMLIKPPRRKQQHHDTEKGQHTESKSECASWFTSWHMDIRPYLHKLYVHTCQNNKCFNRYFQISMGSTCWGKLCAEWYLSFLRAMVHWGLGPLLLSWINLNLNMDKYNHIHRNVGWNYLSFRKLQRLHRWSLGMYNLIPYFIIGVITYTCWG